MENVNGIDAVWGVLHCGTNPGGPCDESNGIGAARACPGASCQSGMHTYRFEWDRSVSPEQLRWYVDDQRYHTVGEEEQMGWRIVVGSDGAGFGYKEALKADLGEHELVDSVADVGVGSTGEPTHYPSVAIEAGRRVAAGEADRALLIAVPGCNPVWSGPSNSPPACACI